MLKNDTGKLIVYGASASSHDQRLISIKRATEKLAQQLNLCFKMVKQTKGVNQIFVYYENENDDPIPLYCNEGKCEDKEEEICKKIRNMIFVLSFHPKHTALKHMRSEIMMSA